MDQKIWPRNFPRTHILIVSRQSEQTYAERGLQAGRGRLLDEKNGSERELLRAVETVAAGKIYVSPLIASLALEKFAQREALPQGLDVLTDRELAVFALIAAEQGVGSDWEESLALAEPRWKRIVRTSNRRLRYPQRRSAQAWRAPNYWATTSRRPQTS